MGGKGRGARGSRPAAAEDDSFDPEREAEEELLVVRSTGQTNRGQPLVLEEVPPEQGGPAEAPPIGGDYLCVAMWV